MSLTKHCVLYIFCCKVFFFCLYSSIRRTKCRDVYNFLVLIFIFFRNSLPVPMFSRNDFSIWSVLKNCIGKELSKITMPVIFNEPLSFLQRMTEYMEYAKLIRIASEQDDPIDRMKYIAGKIATIFHAFNFCINFLFNFRLKGFAVSALASNWERLGKPFNPLLGETYELQRPEFRILCEQVLN